MTRVHPRFIIAALDWHYERDQILMKFVYTLLLLCATAPLAAAQPPPPVVVSGVVQDQTGAVLAGATVELASADGHVVQTTSADAGGAFRFDRVAPGQFELRARYEGFKSASANVRVGTRSPSSQKLVLGIA